MVETIVICVAVVAVAGMACWTVLRVAGMVDVESAEWRDVCVYYVDGRVGLLGAEEVDHEPRHSAEGAADELFIAWHDACGWQNEEQATHVKALWRVAFRSQSAPGQKAAAVRELRGLGAPIPGGFDT